MSEESKPRIGDRMTALVEATHAFVRHRGAELGLDADERAGIIPSLAERLAVDVSAEHAAQNPHLPPYQASRAMLLLAVELIRCAEIERDGESA